MNPDTFGTRRRHPRIPVTIEIKSTHASASVPFVSKDLSGIGIFLHGTRVYPVGAEVKLEFEIPYSHETVAVTAKVIRHATDPETGLVNGMGLEFTNRGDQIAGLIEQYLGSTDVK
jgi:Tfp pilus assembly protein PilZ